MLLTTMLQQTMNFSASLSDLLYKLYKLALSREYQPQTNNKLLVKLKWTEFP